ncbi:MAG: hypothetical protein ABF250_10315 [Polaribacter sp.]|uniref:hypothetical protein n=1 Tax=Polaribacter sp. TaxID=1920175 RepID=UPI00321C23C3
MTHEQDIKRVRMENNYQTYLEHRIEALENRVSFLEESIAFKEAQLEISKQLNLK